LLRQEKRSFVVSVSGSRFHFLVPFLSLAAMAAIADQMTKLWALSALREGVAVSFGPFLSLTLGFNTGASFGIFGGGESTHIILVAVSAVVTTLIIWYAARAPELERPGLSLIVGGATGNLIDRYVRGKVTDFIDLHAGDWHWPALNLADISITLGVIWIIAMNIRPARARPAGD
jgi:signal peptidase II